MAIWPVEPEGFINNNVYTIQYLLNAHGLPVPTDGDFGPETTVAVKEPQSANQLPADGAVDDAMTSAVASFQQPLGATDDGAGVVGEQTWNLLVNGYLSATNGTAAALDVFKAWQADNRPIAYKWATEDAVEQLWQYSPQPMTYQSLSVGAGQMTVTWFDESGSLVMMVNNNVGASYYYVVSAQFSPFGKDAAAKVAAAAG